MSFHKRFYSWNKIIDYIKLDDFRSFDKWFLGPDAHMFKDEASLDFFKAYTSIEENLRSRLFECVRDEGDDFHTELIKCINTLLHECTLESYVSLFVTKWDIKAEEYKSLITK
jgi:hypothetical protein